MQQVMEARTAPRYIVVVLAYASTLFARIVNLILPLACPCAHILQGSSEKTSWLGTPTTTTSMSPRCASSTERHGACWPQVYDASPRTKKQALLHGNTALLVNRKRD
ncbi:unnamed protein product [Prorocentrum cordatum]|uniref:Secreted protein n=1 Tax=Prorocentrum cordatum TaxID=2364126 RepID=A0ABN9V5A0_9DINO|nr:unnamed protein product [Polarella glacialis]